MPEHHPSLWERIIAMVAALAVVALIAYLVIRNEPFRDANLVVLTRIILSVAVAIIGATIPGFLGVRWSAKGFSVRALGAFGLFVVTFLATPKVLPALDDGIADAQQKFNQQNQRNVTVDDQTLTLEQIKLKTDLYEKRGALQEEWRKQYAEYTNQMQKNPFSSAFERQTISIRMAEIAESIESINDSLAALEHKARESYQNRQPPLPPGPLTVTPQP